ncbi:hypothetical protein BH11PAT2_BH11PAT2_06400 [soil metagenome]
MKKQANTPKTGDIIYLESEFYVSHGADDMIGGKAIVKEVLEAHDAVFITTELDPSSQYRWEGHLESKQEELKAEFGDSWAHFEPDIRPEFNEGAMNETEDSSKLPIRNTLSWKSEITWTIYLTILGAVPGFFFFGTSRLNLGDTIFLGVVAFILILCDLGFAVFSFKKPVLRYFQIKSRVIYLAAGIVLGIAVSPYVLSLFGLVWNR